MSTLSAIHRRQDSQELAGALHALAQGDRSIRLPVAGSPEERQLAMDFNAVAEQSQAFPTGGTTEGGDAERRTEQFAEQLLAQSQYLVQELKRQQTELTRLTEHIVQQLTDGPLPVLRARSRQQRLATPVGAASLFSLSPERQAELSAMTAGEKTVMTLVPHGSPCWGADLFGRCQVTSVPACDGRTALRLARHLAPVAILVPGPLPDLELGAFLALLCRSPFTRHIPVFIAIRGSESGPCLQLNAWTTMSARVMGRVARQLPDPVQRLLVVDGDETRRSQTADQFQAFWGAGEAIAVGSGKEACSLVAQGVVDGLVVTQDLEDMDAFDLLQRLTEQPPTNDFPFMLAAQGGARLGRIGAVCDRETRNQDLLAFVRQALSFGGMSVDHHQPAAHLGADGQPCSSRKAVVVDDDLNSVYPIVHMLEQKGITPLVADCGKEGLETLLAHGDADLVLMDVAAPHVEGLDTIHIIRGLDEFRHLPIIAMANSVDPSEHVRLTGAGASDCLTKPVNPAQLDALLRVWLA